MTIGEALSLRARQAQKLNDLRGRIKQNALVQEGTDPAEDAVALMEDYLTTSGEHRHMLTRIALTNVATEIDGVKLIALLQEREEMIRARNMFNLAANSATSGGDMYRYTRTELKTIPCVNVAELRVKEEDLTEQIRVLDAQIQQVNWATDLI